jgi:hypothetical protein
MVGLLALAHYRAMEADLAAMLETMLDGDELPGRHRYDRLLACPTGPLQRGQASGTGVAPWTLLTPWPWHHLIHSFSLDTTHAQALDCSHTRTSNPQDSTHIT